MQKIALNACGCVCTLPGWSGLVFFWGGGVRGRLAGGAAGPAAPRRRAGGRSALGTAALSWRLPGISARLGWPGQIFGCGSAVWERETRPAGVPEAGERRVSRL